MNEREVDEFAAELAARGFIVSAPPKPYNEDVEFELFCPWHEDPATSKKPSATWKPMAKRKQFTTGVMHCHKPACKLKADARQARVEFLAGKNVNSPGGDDGDNVINLKNWSLKGLPGKESATPKAAPRGKAKQQPTPDAETFALYSEVLMEDAEHLDWMLKDKGITADTLAKFEWGWVGAGKQCYCYPIYNADGSIHGMRLYDPFHLDGEKPRFKKRWYATEDKNHNQLYGVKQLNPGATSLLLFEGETDTMLAHQDGFEHAITHTGGAGFWSDKFLPAFAGKVVYICYDPDDAGRKGRAKVSKALRGTAEAVRFVELPGGDYCEWRAAGHTAEDFAQLLVDAEEDWRAAHGGLSINGDKVLDSVSQLKDVSGHKTLEVAAYIAGKSDTSYRLPHRITVRCNQDQGPKCEHCPIALHGGGEMGITFSPDDDDALIEMMEAKAEARNKLLREVGGMRCSKAYEVEYNSTWYVEQVSLQDPVDRANTHSVDSMFTAHHFYNEGNEKITTGEDWRVVGRTLSDPRTQRLSYAIWHAEQIGTDLDKYKLDVDSHERLLAHRPAGWNTIQIQQRLKAKYRDLSANVTRIFGRDDMHLMYDLVTHSALSFQFQGREITKGWLDAIIMGDTRTGKTEMVNRLNAHYRSGFLVSGENASYAGLVGGSAEMSGSRNRMPMWGHLVRYDRRALQVDEAAGLKDIMPAMSSVRSNGWAEVNKQGGGRARARVRLLWLTNPAPSEGYRSTRMLRDIRGGAAQAIMAMVGMQEDVARFDMAMSAASADVGADEIMSDIPQVSQRYTSSVCHESVMFAWSRRADQITFADGVEDYINERAREIAAKYTENPPFVQASNFNHKLARMCVALAALTYSTDETGEVVIVRRGHVAAVTNFVQRRYDDPMFGYKDASVRAQKQEDTADASVEEVRAYLEGKTVPQAGLPDGQDMARGLNEFGSGYFSTRDLCEAVGVADSSLIVRYFTERGMMERAGNGKVDMKPRLVQILREIQE